jgi:GGDEF domain-containing protein
MPGQTAAGLISVGVPKLGRPPADGIGVSGLSDIIAALRHDPERGRFLLRLGIGGALLIIAWDQLASLVLPALAVVPIALLLLLAYGGAITLAIARAVQAASRWQYESAVLAEKLLTSRRREHDDQELGGLAQAAVEASFHQAYFLIRLEEQVKRARREGYPLCLICLDVSLPGHELSADVLDAICYDVANLASSQSKTVELASTLAQTVFVFCLPRCDREAARSFVSKALQNLGSYWCHFGIAAYPAEATSATALLEQAWHACEESRGQTATARRKAASAAV